MGKRFTKRRYVLEARSDLQNMILLGRMVSSGLLRRVALVRTDVSEEPGASFVRVTKICALGTTQAATSNRRTLRRNTNKSYMILLVHGIGGEVR
jgi:hypothetical protein